MAKASQVVLSENEFYLIKAPNGKVLEVKNFNTEDGAAIRLWDYAGHPWQQWKFVDAGEGRWRIQNRFTGKMMDLALGGVTSPAWPKGVCPRSCPNAIASTSDSFRRSAFAIVLAFCDTSSAWVSRVR